MQIKGINERVFYVPINTLLGYIGKATSKRMKMKDDKNI